MSDELKYRKCRECDSTVPDLLDDFTLEAVLAWDMTSSTAVTIKATLSFSEQQP